MKNTNGKVHSRWLAAVLFAAFIAAVLSLPELGFVKTAYAAVLTQEAEEEEKESCLAPEVAELLSGSSEGEITVITKSGRTSYKWNDLKDGVNNISGLGIVTVTKANNSFHMLGTANASMAITGSIGIRMQLKLIGVGDYPTLTVGEGCNVTLLLSELSHSGKVLETDGALLYNRGNITLWSTDFVGGGSSGEELSTSGNGGAIWNSGSINFWSSNKINNVSSGNCGGGVYNKGTITIEKGGVAFENTKADKGDEIYNAKGGSLSINGTGEVQLYKTLINKGTLKVDQRMEMNVPVVNLGKGHVESGIYVNTITGGTINPEKVSLVYSINGWRKTLPYGVPLLKELSKDGPIRGAVYPLLSNQEVKEEDLTRADDMKYRSVNYTALVRVSYVTNCETKLEDELVPKDTVIKEKTLKQDGWYLEGWYTEADFKNKYDFSKPVTGNLTLYAKWIEIPVVPVRVSFDSRGGSAVESQLVFFQTKAVRPVDPKKEGFIFTGWYKEAGCSTLFDFNTLITAPLTLYAGWKAEPVKYVSVTFVYGNGEADRTVKVRMKDPVQKPADPKKTDCTFSGWYCEAECINKWDFSSKVMTDMKLYAGWIEIPVIPVRVTFDLGDGSILAVKTVLLGEAVEKPEDPVKRTAFFTGWYKNPSCTVRWNFKDAVTEDTKLYAGWKDKKNLKVEFEVDGGEPKPADQEILEGDCAVKPSAVPQKTGYNFVSWVTKQNGREAFDFSKPLTENTKIYALWIAKTITPVRVEFDSMGGTEVGDQWLEPGSYATEPAAPKRDLHLFSGWYEDPEGGTKFDFTKTKINDHKTLYAVWIEKPVVEITVTFDCRGGKLNGREKFTESIFLGDPLKEPEGTPEHADRIFLGWYEDESCTVLWDFSKTVSEDTTIYAGWRNKKQLTVSFDSAGGSAVAAQSVKELAKAAKPADPTREGYTFKGWFEDIKAFNNPYDFERPVVENLTLTARWLQHVVNPVKVTFYPQNGDPEDVVLVDKGDTVSAPASPERPNHSFIGWYLDQDALKKYDFSTPVNDELKLYAGWIETPVIPVRVTFDLGDGSILAVKTVLLGETVEKPEDPVKRTAFFTGWYKNPSCTVRWNFKDAVTEDTKLYAGWKVKKNLKVEFEVDGGEPKPADQEILEGDCAVKPSAVPRKTGYNFVSWVKDTASRETFDFSKPLTENTKIYALWIAKTITPVRVEFDSMGGTEVGDQWLEPGSYATEPAAPKRDLHLFSGWYEDPEGGTKFDFTKTKINDHKTLYAVWIEKPVVEITVTFDCRGGKLNGREKFTESIFLGDPLKEPEGTPEHADRIFLGWYEDESCTVLWDFSKTVSEDTTIYAGWRNKKQLTVSFDSAGGSAVAAQSVKELAKAAKPADPTREGYTFKGWFEDIKAFNNPYDFERPVVENLTLTARWLQHVVNPVTVTFYPRNGDPEDVVWVDKGTTVSAPASPERPYYTFSGWYLDQDATKKYDFSTPVNDELKLYAGWIMNPVNPVTVTYDFTLAQRTYQQVILSGEPAEEPTAPALEKYFFTGWYADRSCTKRWNFAACISENMTLYAGWREKKLLTVTFDSQGGSTESPQQILEQERAQKPEVDPLKPDHIFCGWCKDAEGKELFDFNDLIMKDTTIYAHWLQKAVVPVKVVFESNGGTKIGAQVLAQGDPAQRPKDPTMEFFTFAGWYSDPEWTVKYDFTSPVMEDITLYAGWIFTPVEKVNVTFDFADGKSAQEVKVLVAGDCIPEPTAPVRQDHFFTGWYEDGTCTKLWDFTEPVYSDMTLTAGWRKKKSCSVVFIADGSTFETQTVLEMDKAVKPGTDPQKAANKFYGWYTSGKFAEEYNFDTPVTSDMQLYARFLEDPVIPVWVTFDSNGGTPVGRQVVASPSTAVEPEKPTRTGYTFVAWVTDLVTRAKFNFETLITKDITLFAEWLQEVVIPVWLSFDTRGGSTIDPQLVASGSNAIRPTDPEKEGYRFGGWYEDTDCLVPFSFSEVLTEEKTIYAAWEDLDTYTFSFNSMGGSEVPSQEIAEGKCAVKPADPTRAGYIFLFWCTDDEFTQVYDFSKPVREDTEVFAYWLPEYSETVTVTFESNGGSSVDPQIVAIGTKAVRPVQPTRSGYSFRGWYTEAECRNLFDFDTKLTKDLTLYAGWTYTGGGVISGSWNTMNAYDTEGRLYGVWTQDAKGWWIRKLDGSWPHEEWVQCTWQGVLNWYYFTPEGYMASGFITDKDGKTYYLHTAATGSSGTMATSWVQIEGKWYYFNTVSDGTKGAMLKNTVTPDGYTVGADGAWTGK